MMKLPMVPMVSLVFTLTGLTIFAGQSIVSSESNYPTSSFPNQSHSAPLRIELQVHDWDSATWASPFPFLSHAVGFYSQMVMTEFPNGVFMVGTYWDSTGSTFHIPLPTVKYMNVRIQRDPSALTQSVEAWDYQGALIYQLSSHYVDSFDIGGRVDVGRAVMSTAFFRVHSTLVPLNSRPPVTSDHADTLLEFKFDGDLSDASGHGYTAIMTTPSYVTTPYQTVVAKAKTANAPGWADWVSLRAGKPNRLDGTASYSQADGSAAVTYLWAQTAPGALPLIWDSHTIAQPTVQGAVFGSYTFSLTATDADSNTGSASLTVGAVSTDDNGVVVNANPDVDKIFGPMIAFGKNPWGYADERAIKATNLRAAAYTAGGINPPSWATNQTGTVTYTFNGADYIGSGGTTLASAITTANSLSITLTDASKLDLTTFPTRILVGPLYGGKREEVRICSAAGNVLTVCYDGRGIAPYFSYDSYRIPAQAWPSSTPVGQMKVTGSGTAFLSTVCPAGVGPTGAIKYSAGTVSVTAGSASITGNSTTWTSANGIVAGYGIRVQGTHSSTPFVFYAYINAVSGVTSITANRVYPADADSGTFSYQVIEADTRQPTLHYARADGSDAQMSFSSNGCESNTALYAYSGHDIASLNGTTQAGKHYSYDELPGYAGALGVNFYGEDLAHRALYYRSGWTPALTAANVMSDQYITSPDIAGGDVGGSILLVGGGVVGAVAAAVIDNRVDWRDIRPFIRRSISLGVPAPGTCNNDDTRDYSYYSMIVALGAQYDPDTSGGGYRDQWKTALGNIYNWELSCKQADNSWANSGYKWGDGSVGLTVVNGSAAVTGTGFTSALCYGIATGSLTVTNGSATVSGTGFVAGNKIAITGLLGGVSFTGWYRYQYNSPTSITLGVLWPGSSGSATYVIENNDNLTSLGTDINDPQLQKNWSCTYNSPTSLTLNRAWDGTSGVVHLYQNNVSGYSQQPYMMGLKVTQLHYASQTTVNPSGFTALESLAADWLYTTGYDPPTQAFSYCRVMQACEPDPTPPVSPLFDARVPGIFQGMTRESISVARTLSAEAGMGAVEKYRLNPSLTFRTWGDLIYGSLFGADGYTTGGLYADGITGNQLDNVALGGPKWTGLHFGMGMAHQWPAVRLGGVLPASPAAVDVPFDLSAHAGATHVSVSVIAPSSATSSYSCTISPCSTTVDNRQGSHWGQVTYLNVSEAVVYTSAAYLLGTSPTAAPLPMFGGRVQVGGRVKF